MTEPSPQKPQGNAEERPYSLRGGIPLGRILGIPVVLAYSWFAIAAFTVIAYGPVLAHNDPRLGATAYLVAFAYAVLLLISVLVHELAHALTARLYRWPTRKIVLNLWGGHTQFEDFTASPGRSVLVAMAGPAARPSPNSTSIRLPRSSRCGSGARSRSQSTAQKRCHRTARSP